jgi:hypothetical protein
MSVIARRVESKQLPIWHFPGRWTVSHTVPMWYGFPVGKGFRLPVMSSALPALFPYHFSTLSHAHIQKLTHGTSLWHKYLQWKTRAHMTVLHMHASKYSYKWHLTYSSVQIIVHMLSLVLHAYISQWKISCVLLLILLQYFYKSCTFVLMSLEDNKNIFISPGGFLHLCP